MMTGTPINPNLDPGLYNNGSLAVVEFTPQQGDPFKVIIRERGGKIGSQAAGNSTAQRSFEIRGTADPEIALQALIDGPLPIDLHRGLYREMISYSELGADSWTAVVEYSERAPSPTPGTYTVSIDSTGGTILQTHALAQTAFAKAGKTPTDYGLALNVQDGVARGVDRVIPALKIDFRARIATQYLGASELAYGKLIASLTGSANSVAMFGDQFAAGELLFIGATGDLIAEDPLLTFSFLASKNLADVSIAGINGINKLGHEFIWFQNSPVIDSSSNRKSTEIIAAHVGQVYGAEDLTQLSIGVAPA